MKCPCVLFVCVLLMSRQRSWIHSFLIAHSIDKPSIQRTPLLILYSQHLAGIAYLGRPKFMYVLIFPLEQMPTIHLDRHEALSMFAHLMAVGGDDGLGYLTIMSA